MVICDGCKKDLSMYQGDIMETIMQNEHGVLQKFHACSIECATALTKKYEPNRVGLDVEGQKIPFAKGN